MKNHINIIEILDTAFKDISKRVAKIDMINTAPSEIDTMNSTSLIITTNGDYMLTIVLQTSDNVLRAITQNMKRGITPNDTDIPIYTTEYFNILCGHVISAMNRAIHSSARFGIPRLIKGAYEEIPPDIKQRQQLFYICDHGPIKVETLYSLCDPSCA